MSRRFAVHFIVRKLSQLALLSLLLHTGFARADLVPAPIPECVGKPDGTFCKLGDGTAGQCKTNQDTRRPGRSWQSCAKDEHECDRLTVGAECHGYLGKASHCREFSDPDKKKTWRTCQADDIKTDAANTTPAAAAAQSAPAAPAAATTPATAPAAPAEATPPAKKGMFSCSAAGHAQNEGAGGTLAVFCLGLLLFAVSRRARRLI